MNQNSNYVCIDFETRSVCDLPKAGSHKYSQHETTRIQCLAWAIGDDPVSIWFPCDPTPHRLLEHVETGGLVCGWNAGQFEVPLWNNCLLRDHPEWPPLRIEQIDDTMARAYASSLPGSLERCAIAVNLSARKDKTGYSLMMKLCKPTAKWRKNPVGEPEWHDDPEDLIKLGEYCKQDVVVERELRQIIAPLSKRERAIWLADQKINERGIHVDVKAVEDALRLVTAEKADLTKKLHEVSKGKISTGGSVPQVIEFLASEGVELPNLKKRTVSRRLRSEEPMSDIARQVLTIRADLSKSSTSKLSAMLASRDHDGGCRGLFSYHVATTGRWAGRRIQPHNFMRPDEEVFFNQDQIENCIALFGEDHGAEVITMAYAPLLSAVASCMRGLIVAKDGHEFVGGDFIGVENRVLMWLAGEEWMIEEFRKFDRGEGVDNYKLTYSKAFNVPIESVTKPQRLIGKVGALACIAEDELVLTDVGLVPIQNVTLGHKLWDGVEFVSHDGVVYKGEKEVIEYDGLRATSDHVIWTEGESRQIPLGQAAASGARLCRSAIGGAAIRTRRNYSPFPSIHSNRLESPLRGHSLHRMRLRAMDVSWQPDTRAIQRVSNLHSTRSFTPMAYEPSYSYEASMRNTLRPELSSLWRTRNTVSIQKYFSCGPLGIRQLGLKETSCFRSYRQRRALRTRKPSLCIREREQLQHTKLQNKTDRYLVGRIQKPSLCSHDAAATARRIEPSSNHIKGQTSSSRQAEKLARHSKTPDRARTYDILNAGPRNRFTVSGRLVHNCGFAGSVGAYLNMGDNYDVVPADVAKAARETVSEFIWNETLKRYPKEEKWRFGLKPETWTGIKIVVDAWRNAHPNVTQFWWDCQDCAIAAVQSRGHVIVNATGRLKFACDRDGHFLLIRLPSGRYLHYPQPFLAEEMFAGRPKTVLKYHGLDKIRKRDWVARTLTPQILSENVTSGTARDVLSDAMLRAEARDYPIALHVHDELVAQMPTGTGDPDTFRDIMCDSAPWLDGLPVAADCWIGNRYRK